MNPQNKVNLYKKLLRKAKVELREAVYEEGELVESIEALNPQDLLDERGHVRDLGEEFDRFYGGPGRPFGSTYEVLKLADRASREELEDAEDAMKRLNERLDAYTYAIQGHPDEYDPSFRRFEVADLGYGIYIVVTVGGYDI